MSKDEFIIQAVLTLNAGQSKQSYERVETAIQQYKQLIKNDIIFEENTLQDYKKDIQYLLNIISKELLPISISNIGEKNAKKITKDLNEIAKKYNKE